MSAGAFETGGVGFDGDGFAAPQLEGGVTSDGQRYHVTWYKNGVRYIALFRVATCDRVATLQHIRAIRVSARVEERVADVDADVTLADLPDAALVLMRADGFTPANEGGGSA